MLLQCWQTNIQIHFRHFFISKYLWLNIIWRRLWSENNISKKMAFQFIFIFLVYLIINKHNVKCVCSPLLFYCFSSVFYKLTKKEVCFKRFILISKFIIAFHVVRILTWCMMMNVRDVHWITHWFAAVTRKDKFRFPPLQKMSTIIFTLTVLKS